MASDPTASTAPTSSGEDGEMRFKTVLTHLSRPGVRTHGFVNPPVQRGSTVIFPTVQARNDSWQQRKRFEQGTPALSSFLPSQDIDPNQIIQFACTYTIQNASMVAVCR